MDGTDVHERLRSARLAAGEDVEALARRAGVRVTWLRAIEDGRFGDLPPGIYARSAVRAYANAYALDAAEILSACEARCPAVEDPIAALNRGQKRKQPRNTRNSLSAFLFRVLRVFRGYPRSRAIAGAFASRKAIGAEWRRLAAAALDACVIASLLPVIAVGAALQTGVSIAALGASALPLGLVVTILGGNYFVWFGGLLGLTAGQYAAGLRPACATPLTLRAIAERTLLAATADARAIQRLGARLSARRSVRPPAPAPSRLPLPDRVPAP